MWSKKWKRDKLNDNTVPALIRNLDSRNEKTMNGVAFPLAAFIAVVQATHTEPGAPPAPPASASSSPRAARVDTGCIFGAGSPLFPL